MQKKPYQPVSGLIWLFYFKICSYEDGTLWLTQKMIAELFDVQKPAIPKHLQNIYDLEELEKTQLFPFLGTVQIEDEREVTRMLDYYNLDEVTSVGYYVNSVRAAQF